MAASLKFVAQGPMEVLAYRVVQVTGDASYPTGGYTLDLAVLDMKRIVSIEPVTQVGYVIEWNRATSKLMFYKNQATANSNPLVEVTAATNLSAVTVEVLVLGEHR
jgi:hypothetical protein